MQNKNNVKFHEEYNIEDIQYFDMIDMICIPSSSVKISYTCTKQRTIVKY